MLIAHPGFGTHPDPSDEGNTLEGCTSGGQGSSPAACPHYSQSWFTTSLYKPDFAPSLQGVSLLLQPLCGLG